MKQDETANAEQFPGPSPMRVVFRKAASCETCRVRRRTVFSSVKGGFFDQPGCREVIVAAKDTVLLDAGVVSPYLYCIHEGWCKVTTRAEAGKNATLWFAGPGDMIGLSSACTGETNSFAVVAMEKMTVCRIPAEALRENLSQAGDLFLRVAEQLNNEVTRVERRVEALRLRLLQKKTAHLILRLFKGAPPGTKEKTLPPGGFCRSTGATPDEVQRCLDLFILGKLVRIRNGAIRIIDRDRLVLVATTDEEWN